MLVAAFRGWNDGAQGATLAAGYLAQAWSATRFADIDPEEFYDFQVTRPHIALEEGLTRKIDWPETAFFHAELPEIDRDVLLLLGVEPNLRWRTFTAEIVDLAQELGVELVITLGALLADVPHTRPSPVTGSATDPDLVRGARPGRLALRRAQPGSSASSTTRAARPASPRRASGPPCRTTPRLRRARRRRSRSAPGSPIFSAPRSTSRISSAPRTPTSAR